MKLTNAMRSAFVRSAMDDVPEIDYEEPIKDAVMAKAVDMLPETVRKLWENPELRSFVSTQYLSFHAGDRYVGIYIPGKTINSHTLPDHDELVRAENELILDAAKELTKVAEAQCAERAALRKKLEACAASVSTRKALATLLPEFEKYLPQDDTAACRTLPAVANVVADFVKAGWPKERQAA